METRLLLNYKFQVVKGYYGFNNEILTILMSLHTKLWNYNVLLQRTNASRAFDSD